MKCVFGILRAAKPQIRGAQLMKGLSTFWCELRSALQGGYRILMIAVCREKNCLVPIEPGGGVTSRQVLGQLGAAFKIQSGSPVSSNASANA